MRLAPGGPFDLEHALDARVMENLRRIYQLDRPVVVAYVMLATLLFVTVNLLADILYAALDPRVKLAGTRA